MTWPIISKWQALTVDATTTTRAWKINSGTHGGAGNKLIVDSVTGLTGTIQRGLEDSAGAITYTDVDTYDHAGNFYAAGTTITFTARMELSWDGTGYSHVQVTRVGGTTANIRPVATFAPWSMIMNLLRRISGSASGAGLTANTLAGLREVTLTFSTDTSAYADNDVLADSQILASVVRANDAKGILAAFRLLDEDDNTAIDIDMYLLSANVSMGTENAAISITDANARNILGSVRIEAAEWDDLINSKQVSYPVGSPKMGVPITPVTGTDDIYVALVVRSGTPTYTATGLTARFWFLDCQ